MPLEPSRTTLDFGIVPQASLQRLYFELLNRSDNAVELDRMDASCDCLEVHIAKVRIEPGEKVLACAQLNLQLASDFVGGLRIEVMGFSRDADAVFAMTTDADVRPATYFEPFGQSERQETGIPPLPIAMP
jgi:hypothetical protein